MTAQQRFVSDVRKRAGGTLTPGLAGFCYLILGLSDQQFIGAMGWLDKWEQERSLIGGVA